MKRTCALAVLVLPFAAGCGARTMLDTDVATESCDAVVPTCIAPNALDPCGEASVVGAVCGASSHAWSCPTGSRVYARAPASQTVCKPFESAIGTVGPWGLSAMTHIPTDDGRCLWIADSATLLDGTTSRNVALQADPTAPYGTCPTTSLTPPTPIVTIESGAAPSLVVQIDGGYRLGGKTHVLYRVFRLDATATFGAVEVGGGVGRWDQPTQRIVIPTVVAPFPWGLDLDLGDAQLASTDGTHAFVWGCKQPGMFLLQGCELARLDAADNVELFSMQGTWIPTTDASLGAVMFGGGSWTSDVVAAPSGFRHVYIADFGNELQSDVATNVTGTWTSGPNMAACDLPLAADPNSFCAGPEIHSELSDPTRIGEMAVTYGVGSTVALPPATPNDYWARLVFTQ
jgi:hypothetical protein